MNVCLLLNSEWSKQIAVTHFYAWVDKTSLSEIFIIIIHFGAVCAECC